MDLNNKPSRIKPPETCGTSDFISKEAEERINAFLTDPATQDIFKKFDRRRRQGAAARDGAPPYIQYEADEIIYLPLYMLILVKLYLIYLNYLSHISLS